MALTKIVIETEIVGGDKSTNQLEQIKEQAIDGAKSLGDLKKEFKALEDQLTSLVPGTTDYVNKLKELGEVKSEIEDVKKELNGFADGTSKLSAFSGVLSGVVSGFEAASGAAALFGADSGALEEQIKNLQGVMAFSEGIKGVLEVGDSFKTLTNAIKSTELGAKAAAIAQRVWNAVMAANPIGLIIAGLTALVGIIALVVNSMEDENEAQKQVIAAREREIEVMDSQMSKFKEEADFRRQLAQAQGKSAEEILKQNKLLNEQESKQLSDRIQLLRKNIYARIELFKTSNEDEIKELQKKNDEDFKIIAESSKRQRELLRTNVLEQAKFDEEQRKKAEEKAKEADAKAKERAKKKADDDLAAAEKWRQEQAKFIQYEIDALNNKYGEQEQIIAEQQLATKIQLGTATPDEIAAWNQYKLDLQKKYNDEVDAELKRISAENERIRKIDEDREKKKAEEEKLRLENLKKSKEQEVQLTLQGLNTIQSLSDAFAGQSVESQKRAFNIKKAASIAQATIETYQSAQSAYASQMAIPTPDAPVRAAIAAGIAVASGLARVAVIAKQKFNAPSTGGGGTTGGNLGSFSQGGGAQPPQGLTSQNTVTQLNPDGTVAGQSNQQPMKAYVVESESRAVTERVNKLSNNSKIG